MLPMFQFQGPGRRGHHPAPGQAQADRGGEGEAQDKDITELELSG